MNLHPGLKIHFIGIGGVGMSGLAKVLLEKGIVISGSDLNLNNYTASLCSKGAKIFKGHSASHIKNADIVVYSSSIDAANMELREARRLKKPVLSRLTLFQEFTKDYKSIMVTGTHGKTTTSGLIAHILLNLGLDPTVLIGGDLYPFGNACLGQSKYLVAELDESDGEFVRVKPSFAVITNIEEDHLDHFKDFSGLTFAFEKFIKNLAPESLIFFRDDKNLQKFKFLYKNSLSLAFFTYGFNPGCDYRADIISMGPHPRFNFFHKNKCLGEVCLSIPGRHNVLNALTAISTALILGLKFNKIRKVLPDFHGVARRFELKGEINGIKVIEDYAHHPTAIKAVLAAARLYRPSRILAIFQPHRFSRTKMLMDDFSRSFSNADLIAITGIYSASEKNTYRVTARNLAHLIKKRGRKNASFFKTPEDAAVFIAGKAKKGDMILILGAGDVNRILKKVLFNEPLFCHTTLGIGGPAKVFAAPQDKEDLKKILFISQKYSIPYYILGNGSNLLISDRGVHGIVIKLDGLFTNFSFKKNSLTAGSSADLSILRREARKKGLSGLEFTAGIPGTLGGAISMNAGAWSSNIGNLIKRVEIMDKRRVIKWFSRKEINFDYRRTSIEKGSIILNAELKLKQASPLAIKKKTDSLWRKRKAAQPVGEKSAGSIFKNPSHFSAALLIEKAGLKGISCGSACISTRHANFIINRNNATAADVKKLIKLVQRKVFNRFKINLLPEIVMW